MGDMADLAYEQAMRAEFDDKDEDYDPLGKFADPFIWIRANGAPIHIKDMNAHHLGNALAYMEKFLEGYTKEMPAIYFNMMAEAKKKGTGLTDKQIDALIRFATKPKPVKFCAFDGDTNYDHYNGTILRLEEDPGDEDGEVSLNICDSDGAVECVLMTFKNDGKIHLHAKNIRLSGIRGVTGFPETAE